MEWAAIGSVVGGSVALCTAIVAIPLTPGRYWSWRLRKLMQTVDCLDDGRHENQREVLLRRADRLASKVASIYAVPTLRYVWLDLYLTIALATVVAVGLVTNSFPTVSADWVTVAVVPVLLALSVVGSMRMRSGIADDRREFIRQGCPPDYVPVYVRLRREERRERERLDAARAEKRGERRRRVRVWVGKRLGRRSEP